MRRACKIIWSEFFVGGDSGETSPGVLNMGDTFKRMPFRVYGNLAPIRFQCKSPLDHDCDGALLCCSRALSPPWSFLPHRIRQRFVSPNVVVIFPFDLSLCMDHSKAHRLMAAHGAWHQASYATHDYDFSRDVNRAKSKLCEGGIMRVPPWLTRIHMEPWWASASWCRRWEFPSQKSKPNNLFHKRFLRPILTGGVWVIFCLYATGMCIQTHKI